MAMSLASLKKTKAKVNPIGLFYGPEKVGKTALAAGAPAPILIQTPGENPPSEVEIDTFGEVADYDGFMGALTALFSEEHSFETLIIDAADGLERMVNAEACKRNNWPSIEEPGYGKGYVEALNIWTNEVMVALNDLRNEKGMSVLIIAHSEIWKFDSPTSDSYSRYRPNLRKNIADLIQANADIIAFINHRVSIVKEKAAFNQETKRGDGAGLRVIYLDERPGFIAGNRYGMPSELPYKKGSGWSEIAKHLPKPEAA